MDSANAPTNRVAEASLRSSDSDGPAPRLQWFSCDRAPTHGSLHPDAHRPQGLRGLRGLTRLIRSSRSLAQTGPRVQQVGIGTGLDQPADGRSPASVPEAVDGGPLARLRRLDAIAASAATGLAGGRYVNAWTRQSRSFSRPLSSCMARLRSDSDHVAMSLRPQDDFPASSLLESSHTYQSTWQPFR